MFLTMQIKMVGHMLTVQFLTKTQTNKWTYNNKSVFPLTSTGFSDTVSNNTQLDHFPRWFG